MTESQHVTDFSSSSVAGGVGSDAPRVDAHDKVVGAAQYAADRIPENALFAKVVFSNEPHARMISIDTSACLDAPGVVTVLTAADVPVNEFGLTMFDQPVLVGLHGTERSAVDPGVSRWEADKIAVVIAETAEQAAAAAALIDVTWRQRPVIESLDEAVSDEVLIHPEAGSNTYYELKIRKGDMDAGWAAADAVVEGTYEVPRQEHAYLQVEAATAWVDDDGRVTVETGGQWAWEDQQQIAHALDVDPNEVRVIYAAIGGAFGGKEDMTLQIVMALAARKLHEMGIHRPVHCGWSREESIVGHHKRHRATIHARLGATTDGKITAVEAEVLLDAGAYNFTSNKVLGNAHLSVAGPYEVPNAHIDSKAIYTTTVPGGAFRGFGGPQGAFVAETQMNKMAEKLGIDPVELRRRNVLSNGSEGITQAVMPEGVTLPQVIDKCATEADMDSELAPGTPFAPVASLPPSRHAVVRGRGFASGYKNVGFSFGFPERCEAEVRLHGEAEDDVPTSAEVFHGGAEVGQGAHQAFRQMTSEATGVPLEAVSGTFSDTATTGDSGSVSASRMTFMAGNSILGAAEEAEKAWLNGERPAIGTFRYTPPPTESLDPETGSGQPNFSYGYMAQAVEVSVDRETGHIRVDRVTSTHDVGRAINSRLVKGQIEGAVVQAHGYVLSENLRVDEGRITNPRFSSYLIPGIGDIPEHVESVIMELADPHGPWGARGMAEMPYITYAPAVIAAVHDATGVWFDEFPLTPSRVLKGLEASQEGPRQN